MKSSALERTCVVPCASRIVPACTTVTTPAAEADFVATEWGVASLRGIDYAERARRLVALAYPDHRDALTRARRKLP